MAWSGQYFSMTYVAGEDHSAELKAGIAIAINDNLVANTGKEAAGILLSHSKPKSGEQGSIGVMGIMKYRAGAAVTADALLTVTTSGFFITLPASGFFGVGRALDTVASGGIGTGMFDFSKPKYDSTSN
jgi:hypothetical protein